MAERFTLTSNQVPFMTLSEDWTDVLRWCLCVMDPTDTRMSLIAGCLSRTAKGEHLTERQAEACNAIFKSLISDFAAGILVCQNTPPDPREQFWHDLKPEAKH